MQYAPGHVSIESEKQKLFFNFFAPLSNESENTDNKKDERKIDGLGCKLWTKKTETNLSHFFILLLLNILFEGIPKNTTNSIHKVRWKPMQTRTFTSNARTHKQIVLLHVLWIFIHHTTMFCWNRTVAHLTTKKVSLHLHVATKML